MLAIVLTLLSADVLDVGPTQPYATIQDAVDASNDGDLIRVDSGTYPYFGVFGRSLQIVAREDGGEVTIDGTVRIQSTSADQTVLLDGLSIHGAPDSTQAALVVAGTAGPVRIQDCDVVGTDGPVWFVANTAGRVGLNVIGADDLTFQSCLVQGGLDFASQGRAIGQAGAIIRESTVTFWNSDVIGTDSSFASWGRSGGDGVRAFGSDVFFHGCSIQGGDGADGYYFGGIGFGTGGCAGRCVLADACTMRYRDIDLSPGNFSPFADGYNCDGPTGSIVNTGGTTASQSDGVAADLTVGHAWQQSGDPLSIEVTGPAGYAALLIIGPETGRLVPTFPGYVGDVHVIGPAGAPRRLFLGAAPAALQSTVPDFGSTAMTQWYVQSALVGGGEIVLGPVRSLRILGDGW